VGKIAEVLVISGNLLEDLNDLTDIHMVIHNGTIIRDGN
jgi:imidazolonepropionase-like amidohydrolase